MQSREKIWNVALAGLIVALAVLMLFVASRPAEILPGSDPGMSPARGAEQSETEFGIGPETSIGPETQYAGQPPVLDESTFADPMSPGRDRFPHLLDRNPFQTIIAKPTPVVTPPPTPLQPPPLSEVLNNWKVMGVMPSMVYMSETPEGNDMFPMEAGGEPHVVMFNTWQLKVSAVRVDDQKFEVELKSDIHKETVVKKMSFE